nr:unnamed protein product [Callosobruchus chinensis]
MLPRPSIVRYQKVVPKRALGSNEQPGSAKKSLIQDFRSYLFRAKKYFSPSNLLTLYKAQIRPSLEYCSHIWGAAAPTTLSILDAVQRRAIRLIGDPILTCHLQPLSHRCAVDDLSLFYRYSNGFCSFELTSIIPPLSKSARCTRGTTHPKAVVLHTSRTKRYDTTAPLSAGCPDPGVDCLVMYLLSTQVLAYSSPASTNFP